MALPSGPIPPSTISAQLQAITRRVFVLTNALRLAAVPDSWEDNTERAVMVALSEINSPWWNTIGYKLLRKRNGRYRKRLGLLRRRLMKAAWAERDRLPPNIVVMIALSGGLKTNGNRV